ncbi:MAG: hypothetical protein ACI8Y4_003912 [Candidatus Poriferisodalaceae bacterium]
MCSASSHPSGRPRLPNISDRPETVGDRSELGHWEADQIIGAQNRSSMLTLTEQVTRYPILVTMANGYGIDCWFCEPHSPWQRGQVENVNRQWRWWFPSGVDLAGIDPAQANHAANIINGQRDAASTTRAPPPPTLPRPCSNHWNWPSRSGNSNDGAHVEQNSWTHVRTMVGYLRYDTEEELDLLNEIWGLDAGFTNLILAQQKLVSKVRNGAKVTKKYDRAQTPDERVKGHPAATPAMKRRVARQRTATHPGHLSRQIDAHAGKLETMALNKAAAPVKPPVNRSFVNPPHAKKTR